jgi:hypothetical protein
MAENRELKKQVSAKQGARNDEILDKEVRRDDPLWNAYGRLTRSTTVAELDRALKV